jgi:D-beta-D-heptose 7-phosphate kinase/D-beta-D-heptose 1-phosphate adenosyltransferase
MEDLIAGSESRIASSESQISNLESQIPTPRPRIANSESPIPNPQSPIPLNPARLDAILAAMRGRRVLVVGDLMLDEYVCGRSSRVSPEAPVLVVEVENTAHSLGGAANVARNAQQLGAAVRVAGVVGQDGAAGIVRQLLASCGCSAEGVLTDADRPTTVKTRVLAHGQQVVRVDRETRRPVGGAVLERLLRLAGDWIGAADAVILSDYAKGTLAEPLVRAAVARAAECGRPLAANLKPPRIDAFRGVGLATFNLAEAAQAAGQPIADARGLFDCGTALRARLDCRGLLVTRGAEGAVLFGSGADPLVLAAQPVQVFDVTGAGDTVVGVAALALAAGASCAEAAALGTLAGNVKVTKRGTAAVDAEEIRRFARNSWYGVSSHAYETLPPRPRRAAA